MVFHLRVDGLNVSDLAETTIQRKVKRKDRNKKKKNENAEDRGGKENVDIDKKKNMRTGKDNAEEERSQNSEKENSIRSKRLVAKASPYKLKHVNENTENTSVDKVVERVGQMAIKQKNTLSSKAGKNTATGPFAIPASPKQMRGSSVSKRQIIHQSKSSVENGKENHDDGDDSIVSGFVGSSVRAKSDVTRRPALNTVEEREDGSDRDSLVSNFVNIRKAKSFNQREQDAEGFSCDFCGTEYDDAKDLRRHMKAKHR